MRNIDDIINQILDIIKNKSNLDLKKTDSLVAELNSLKESLRYRAPELSFISWNELAYILNTYLDPERSDWEKEIADIFGGNNEIQ